MSQDTGNELNSGEMILKLVGTDFFIEAVKVKALVISFLWIL